MNRGESGEKTADQRRDASGDRLETIGAGSGIRQNRPHAMKNIPNREGGSIIKRAFASLRHDPDQRWRAKKANTDRIKRLRLQTWTPPKKTVAKAGRPISAYFIFLKALLNSHNS
jgi:hypothetical protein